MTEEAKVESQEADKDEDKDELESVLEDSEDKSDKDKDKGTEKDKEDKEDGDKDKDKDKDEESDPVELLRDEVKDLRQMLRTSKRELTQTQARLERVGKRSVAPNIEDDEDEEDEEDKDKKGKEESLTSVEELQNAISYIGTTRGPALDILLETMEQAEKYKDIRDVCSRSNFDDIFEVIAQDATKAGGDFDEALLEVELNVWSKSNPYRYMYDLIKKYHPTYTKVKEEDGDKDKKTLAKAPGTIIDKGGDSDLKSGWTAKRIDDLPEDELHTVPKDIYKNYMRDELK